MFIAVKVGWQAAGRWEEWQQLGSSSVFTAAGPPPGGYAEKRRRVTNKYAAPKPHALAHFYCARSLVVVYGGRCRVFQVLIESHVASSQRKQSGAGYDSSSSIRITASIQFACCRIECGLCLAAQARFGASPARILAAAAARENITLQAALRKYTFPIINSVKIVQAAMM